MPIQRLLIANRGEVAVRIARTAAEMNIATVAIYSKDDAACLHVAQADDARALPGTGAAAYLDVEAILAVAKEARCDALHPGWGFLSEGATLARRCEEEGIVFVGPAPATLEALGDKTQARQLAEESGVPVLRGSPGPVTLEEAQAFFRTLEPGRAMVIKAVGGGGGRGMRVVAKAEEIESAFTRCQSEASRSFGNGDVYVEERMERARHIEVQIVGDGTGAVTHLWERDCSVQRRHQKIVEIAPSPVVGPELRERITADAVRMAARLAYSGVGTFEFLVDAPGGSDDGRYAFIEANARLQVEHTVTEQIFGLDLVQAQLRIAEGATLEALGLTQAQVPEPRGSAMQLRVNMERVDPLEGVIPSAGTLTFFQPPAGPGVRTDTFGYTGYAASAAFDSLLAKVIVHAPSGRFDDLLARGGRALREFRVDGVTTNISFLKNLLEHPEFRGNEFHTTFVDEHMADLAAGRDDDATREWPPRISGHTAGAQVDSSDPLAVLTYGKSRSRQPAGELVDDAAGQPGTVAAPMQGTVVSIAVQAGERVRKGQEVAVLSAMKMEHQLLAPVSGVVRSVRAVAGDTIVERQVILLIEESEGEAGDVGAAEEVDLDHIRDDLAEVVQRHELALDTARPKAVERRRRTGHRTARENVEDLCDPGTFVEYGPLVLAAQRRRRTIEDLIERSPADGLITGIGSINGDLFEEPANRCLVMAYDYTVFAGTQGGQNHRKMDRMIEVAEQIGLPMVLFAEGGGGRPGDTDGIGGGGGSTRTFADFARLSGLVPMVGITTGRCFAGNAALLGCCDVIIATEGSNIGMGGPAMVEGGGLGVFAPEEIGPMEVQVPNGVVDIAVADEAEAVQVTRQYLSYFQGPTRTWEAPDQRLMRQIVPENRLRVYDVRRVIETLADAGTVLELRKDFGAGMITSFIRVEGRAVGIVANDPRHFGGAITSDGSDKAARFMQICDAFDVPVLFLCDTPGIMVGPEIEKTALVRHSSRMFVIGASLTVPCMTIVLRKAYGLGALAMGAGSFKEPLFTVSWPTGEYGGMGLEGSVKLGYRNELAAIEDPEKRRAVYEEMVAKAYEHGKALNEASLFGVDDAIDPADSRLWVASLLKSVRQGPRPAGKKRNAIDAW